MKKLVIILSLLLSQSALADWSGTAFFINNKGTMATAGHVVKHAKYLMVLYKNHFYNAFVIAADYSNDVAIIQAPAIKGNKYYPLMLSPSKGMEVTVLGFPEPDKFGSSLKKTKGTYRNYSRVWNELQLDVTTYQGNSGSPVLDANKECIGVLVAGLDEEKYDYKGSDDSLATPAAELAKLAIKNHIQIDLVQPSLSEFLPVSDDNMVVYVQGSK